VIPDEAVEAAREAVLNALADLPSGPPGEEVLSVLLAAAWDEGYLAMVDDAFRDRELAKKGSRLATEAATPNPYRKPTDA
jgi:hypothetical protein